MEKGRDPKEEEAQRACCAGDLFHTCENATREESWARAAPDLPVGQHTPSRRSTHGHDRTRKVSCAEVACPCETPGILADTGCQHGMPAGTCTWQCRTAWRAQVSGVHLCPSADVCL